MNTCNLEKFTKIQIIVPASSWYLSDFYFHLIFKIISQYKIHLYGENIVLFLDNVKTWRFPLGGKWPFGVYVNAAYLYILDIGVSKNGWIDRWLVGR